MAFFLCAIVLWWAPDFVSFLTNSLRRWRNCSWNRKMTCLARNFVKRLQKVSGELCFMYICIWFCAIKLFGLGNRYVHNSVEVVGFGTNPFRFGMLSHCSCSAGRAGKPVVKWTEVLKHLLQSIFSSFL